MGEAAGWEMAARGGSVPDSMRQFWPCLRDSHHDSSRCESVLCR